MGKSKAPVTDKSLYDRLSRSGYTPELPLSERKELSLSEQGKRYRIVLSSKSPSVAFCIDGHIILQGRKCDKLVLIDSNSSQPSWMEVFVELKGTDVNHAVEQLRETLKKDIFCHNSIKRKYSRIVASSFPSNKSDAVLEKAKIEFIKSFGCELRKLKSNQPDFITV